MATGKKGGNDKPASDLDPNKEYQFLAAEGAKHMTPGKTYPVDGATAQQLIEKGYGNVVESAE